MMPMKEVTLFDLYEVMSFNNNWFDEALIQNAYEYMIQKHKGVKRVSGEDYSQHPLRVAYRIAGWGFESYVVIAGLLHDVVEDTGTELSEIKEYFGNQTAELVDAVTKVKKILDKYENHKIPEQECSQMSDVKLLRDANSIALLLKTADRIDNLETIDVMPQEKQLAKAVHTRDIIIPALEMEGAYKLVDELESLCFKIEQREQYDAIAERVKTITSINSQSIRQTLALLEGSFSGKPKSLPDSIVELREYIVDFSYKTRSCISLFRQITKQAKNIEEEFDSLLSKKKCAFYDLTLIINQSINNRTFTMSMVDVFFKFYEAIFLDAGIVVLDICKTTYGNFTYILLCDEMKNKYRLFVKSEYEYKKYCLGNSTEMDMNPPWNNVDELAPGSGTFKRKIKVFTRSNQALLIEEDATVLDFAFAIGSDSDMGLTFDHALLNENSEKVPGYRRLNNGDKVEIITSSKVEPQLSWFRDIKTSRAINRLVRYFEEKKLRAL